MQSAKLSRRINLITVVLTVAVAAAAFMVLSATRSKMLSDESTGKRAGGEYSDLRRAYSQTSENATTPDISPAAEVTITGDR